MLSHLKVGICTLRFTNIFSMKNTSVDKMWNAVKKIKRTTPFDNTQQNCNKRKNPDSEGGN